MFFHRWDNKQLDNHRQKKKNYKFKSHKPSIKKPLKVVMNLTVKHQIIKTFRKKTKTKSSEFRA